MSDMNQVSIIGRLTRDPELKYLQSGTQVCNFDMAVNKTFTKDGEKNEQVSYFKFTAWAKLAEVISQYVKKGHRLGVTGELQQKSWDDSEGKKRYSIEISVKEIYFLQPKGSGDQDKTENVSETPPPPGDDDIPF